MVVNIPIEQLECKHKYVFDKETENCSVKRYICKKCGYVKFEDPNFFSVTKPIDNSEFEETFNKFYK